MDFSDNESAPTSASVTVDAEEASAPARFALHDASPNPFTGRAVVRYDVPWRARVKLAVYDVAGRMVRALVDEEQLPGVRQVRWDGRDDRGRTLPAGVYFCRMQAAGFSQVRKVILAR